MHVHYEQVKPLSFVKLIKLWTHTYYPHKSPIFTPIIKSPDIKRATHPDTLTANIGETHCAKFAPEGHEQMRVMAMCVCPCSERVRFLVCVVCGV